ncbi:MAG: 3-oxoacyl-[acyl-carrier-protein] reductase [Acidimicrobiia bacterium]|nr:3-oxoacyl-[acyl-carrier-protein] reductase [Acidimicrobiia bacterium]
MSRVALVTGGSRGIGRAIALRLAGDGMSVAVNYSSNQAAADEVVDLITSRGGKALAVRANVGRPEDVEAMFSSIKGELGPVEVLVNNAGITRDDLLLRMDLEAWDDVIETNLRSVYLCSKAALRAMVRARWGRVISISSVSGTSGNPGQTNYAASKAGMIGFTMSLAKEVASRSITANVVAPGFIETDLTADLDDSVKELVLPSIAMGRFGTSDEIASLVSYLASDDASYITGQTIAVDGGISI